MSETFRIGKVQRVLETLETLKETQAKTFQDSSGDFAEGLKYGADQTLDFAITIIKAEFKLPI
ncbi:hypothetical protein [Brevibacillus sp. HD3.3A]|uniref:hypothetical protein n=1 Tax=Brevibacillus sp. HD3.3A TaxID=2738979 RepID=UPI00156B0D46|nr:hypothetical protein [Brevibacillus sp. HD3.3A]UED72132.1 hypothetical protein HP435_28925 [Brevibacillus sp. HD3.3A]